MKKITLKEYKESLENGFYRLGYTKDIESFDRAIFDKNFHISDLRKNYVFTAILRSMDMIIRNTTEKEEDVYEGFHPGDTYYLHTHNDVTYLLHVYANFNNISVKAICDHKVIIY